MIDITSKLKSFREAIAKGKIKLKPETIKLIQQNKIEKGNPLEIAKVAGILAAKNTSSLIPLCHPLPLTGIEIKLNIVNDVGIEVETTVRTLAKTGVEMEALVGVSTFLNVIWDMTKYLEKDDAGQYPHTRITDIKVEKKEKSSIK